MEDMDALFIGVLREFYQSQGFTHVNLARYEPSFSSFGELERNLPPKLVALEDFTENSVQDLKTDKMVVGINSNARLENGFQAYLPQLDLDYKTNKREDFYQTLEEVLDLFPNGQPVHIAESGAGYHLYGTQKMSLKNWKKFMWDAKETAVDPDFLERSLDIGYSTLRLIAGGKKNETPYFIGRRG